MPLTDIQRKVIEVLRPFRNENNYVAGGAALNQRWPRLSDDMDIFQDQRNQLPDQVGLELQALRDDGLAVEIKVENDLIVDVTVREDGFETRVEWSDDFGTCRRFFPAVVDDELGFRLHQADLAVNKVLCASLRREAARDAVDIANIVRRYAPLGPLQSRRSLTGDCPQSRPPRRLLHRPPLPGGPRQDRPEGRRRSGRSGRLSHAGASAHGRVMRRPLLSLAGFLERA